MITMAQFQLLSDDSEISSSYITKISGGCGRSKAQLCLQKIVQTILTIPPPPIVAEEPPSSDQASQRVKSDLKMENWSVTPEHQIEEDPPLRANDKGPSAKETKGFEEMIDGFCENKKKRAAIEINYHDRKADEGDDDCLGLLIEAAKMIFGENEVHRPDDVNASTTPPAEGKQRRLSWKPAAVEFYGDMEPVVRSKRGRTQVLPCKYRDSIMEPLARVSRNRSTIITNKRRFEVKKC